MIKHFTFSFLLISLLCCFVTQTAMSQCSPAGHNWGSASFGISPDPQFSQNVASGTVGEAYSQVMYLKCPSNIGNVIPGSPYAAMAIDSLRLNGVDILVGGNYVSVETIGLSLACNNGTCVFLPTQTYCGDLTGTPTMSGTWPLVLNVNVFFFIGSSISVQHNFEGYELVIEPAAAPANINVTFQVNMQDQTVSADGVHVAGNFNDWNTTANPMTDTNADGIYEATISVAPGTALQYKFLNGNAWGADESVPAECATDLNRTYQLGSENVVIPPVCFGSCSNCIPIVEPEFVTVTFLLNMNTQTVSGNGVHVAGSFQGWNPSGSQLTDSNIDGIYEYTAQVEANSTIQFKFLNGNNWGDGIQEIVPGACGVDDNNGGYNRSLTIGTQDITYGPVCYSSCENCAVVENIELIVRVDMSNQTVSPNGVFVACTFNGWSPTATQMTEYEIGKYQAIVIAQANTAHQYKFLNGNDWPGAETVPAECGTDDNNGGFNRSLTVQSTNTSAPLVCFSECAACVINTTYNLTFKVDMQGQTIGANGVHLAGSFNEFSPTATAMTFESGTVYTVTVAIQPNTIIQYKFLNGNDFSGAETVPFACGVDDGFGGYNRHFTTAHTDVVMPTVCFSACEACIEVSIEEASANNLRIYPNPANDKLVIEMNQPQSTAYSIYNAQGQLVVQTLNASDKIQIDTHNWNAGMYYLVLPGMESVRFVVQH
jgi:hypothetical protein